MFGQPSAGSGEMLLGRGAFEGTVGNGYGNETGNSNGANGTPAPVANGSSAFDLNEFPSLGGSGGGAGGAGVGAGATAATGAGAGGSGGAGVSGSIGVGSSGGGGGSGGGVVSSGSSTGVNSGVNGGGSSSEVENNDLAAALRQQQQLMAQQQHMMQGGNSKTHISNLYRLSAMGTSMGASLGSSAGSTGANFNMATEDFPALPGAPPSGSSGGKFNSGSGLLGGVEGGNQRDISVGSSTPGSSFGASAPPESRTSSNGNGVGMFGELDGLSNQSDSTGLLGGSGGFGNLTNLQSNGASAVSQRQRSSSTSAQSTTGTTTPSGASGSGISGGSALSGDYGLLGLLGVIRMSDADRNALALGSDLTTLGLNLNSSDQLYSTFASPWSENPTTREPQYQLPMCYYMQPPALKTGHLSKFQLETLFYIFYALPKDVLQAYAAQELYSREWRYHVELKLWFKRAGPSDGVGTSGSTMQYIYFDINSWERRLFNGSMNQNITTGLLSEDDIRVKFTNS